MQVRTRSEKMPKQALMVPVTSLIKCLMEEVGKRVSYVSKKCDIHTYILAYVVVKDKGDIILAYFISIQVKICNYVCM